MQKQEFEKMSGATLSEEDYEVIEIVYVYYPHISETEGKTQVSDLYRMFGMAIFHDMYQRAALIRAKEGQIDDLRKDILQLSHDLIGLRSRKISDFLGEGHPL